MASNTYECICCQYITKVNSNWHKHFTTSKHNENVLDYYKDLTCDICQIKFNSIELLNKHLKKCLVNKSPNSNLLNRLQIENKLLKKQIDEDRIKFFTIINEKDNYIKRLEGKDGIYNKDIDIYQQINDLNMDKIPTTNNKYQTISNEDIQHKVSTELKELVNIQKHNEPTIIKMDTTNKIKENTNCNDINKEKIDTIKQIELTPLINKENKPRKNDKKTEKKKISKIEKRLQKQGHYTAIGNNQYIIWNR